MNARIARTGSGVSQGITRGVDHRMIRRTAFSASNKGYGQVSHVEARVESEGGANTQSAHLPFSKPCESNHVSCKKVHIKKNNAALALSRPKNAPQCWPNQSFLGFLVG